LNFVCLQKRTKNKGSIPAWIVARVATEQPLSIAGLRDYVVKQDEAGEAVRADPLAV